MKRLAVLTSGGDAPGMNAVVRSIVRSADHFGVEVYGVRRGYVGLLQGDWYHLKLGDVGDIVHRGGTILHSSRSADFHHKTSQEKAVRLMHEHDIDGLIVIGGNGTFLGGQCLTALSFPVIGIPGTIDNDIMGTEMSIGFDTAVNTAVSCVDRIRDTATSHERTFLIEVMGRATGNLALWVGLAAGAESIIIPERPYNIDDVVNRLCRGISRGKKHSIIIVAEGAAKASDVAKEIEELTKWDTRIIVLGHIQRGGSPTALDRLLAGRMGAKAVEVLVKDDGANGMIALENGTVKVIPWPNHDKRDNLADLVDLAHRLSV